MLKGLPEVSYSVVGLFQFCISAKRWLPMMVYVQGSKTFTELIKMGMV